MALGIGLHQGEGLGRALRRFGILHSFGRFVTLMRTMRSRQGFFLLFFVAWALLGAEAQGAVVTDPTHPYIANYHYQLRDVSGVPDGHTIEGAQWFATSFENWFWNYFNDDDTHGVYRRTLGGGTEVPMLTSADLIYRFNNVYVDEPQPYANWPSELYDDYMDPIESLYLVIPEGRGDWTIRFANDRAHHYPWPQPDPTANISNDVMEDIVISDRFDLLDSFSRSTYPKLSDYYTVQATPDRPQRIAPLDSLQQTFRFQAKDTDDYGSALGHVTFRQSASLDVGYVGYRESLKIPLVVANVHDGLASDPGNELYFDMTLSETSGDLSYISGDVIGDVITRTQFRWGVAEDMTRSLGTLFIMTPYGGRMPTYTLTSRITNRTGTRYRDQRYDTLQIVSYDVIGGRSPEDIKLLHWAYDLPSDRYNSLPKNFLLHPQSQIAPGLVTVYENKVDTTYGTSPSFRLYPFSRQADMHTLTLSYRRIRGMTRLGRVYSSLTKNRYRWRVTAFGMAFADVVKNETNTEEELKRLMGKPPVMPRGGYDLIGVSDKYIKADALNAFTITCPVPAGLISMDLEVLSRDASGTITASRDIPAQVALLPTQIRFCVPRQEQLLVEHWDELEQLDGDRLLERFSQFGTVWVRSPKTNEFDMNLFSAIGTRGADLKECVRAFIHDDHLYLDFNILLADAKSPKDKYTAYCEIVRDDNVPYILLGDGAADGVWDLGFYVAKTGPNPQPGYPDSGDKQPKKEETQGGGGCNTWGLSLLALAGGALSLFRNRKTR